MTWGRIQYPAMSAFEGASMPYSDQVKENSESMGKEGEKMVKESDFGRLGQKIGCGHFVSQKLHRNRLSVLPLPPPGCMVANMSNYSDTRKKLCCCWRVLKEKKLVIFRIDGVTSRSGRESSVSSPSTPLMKT